MENVVNSHFVKNVINRLHLHTSLLRFFIWGGLLIVATL